MTRRELIGGWVGLVAVVAVAFGGGWLLRGPGEHAAPAVCWAAVAEDSDPHQAPCDYRDGAWWPMTAPLHLPPCDDDAPGRPVVGTCWLADDDGVAVWPHPYAPTPLAVLEPSQ